MPTDTSSTTRRELLKLSAGTVAAASVVTAAPLASASTGTDRPMHYRTLVDVAGRIARGEVSSTAVTQALLARIDSLEPTLHTYYSVEHDLAMAQAGHADGQLAAGERIGRVPGVRIAVKDLCHMKGTATTAGHSFRRRAISDRDATVVARLQAEGAVILGKLATTEGAMVGYHRDFAVPRNPWGDLDRWPGVSSGGSGASPAAGLCFAALGTDTGGSIRFPSAANGLVGIKPTWGRVSRHGVLDLAPTLDHIGPMTRSVRDAARVLGVIAGYDPADATSLTADVPDYEAAIDKGVEGLRIGWDDAYATTDVAPWVALAVRGVIEDLAALGADIVEVTVPTMTPEESDAWGTLAAAEAAVGHAATYPSRADEYGQYFREFLANGHAASSVDVARGMIGRKNAAGRVAPVFDNIDVLISPTLATESFRYDPEDAYGGFDMNKGTLAGVPFEFFGRSGRFITIWDYNGYPTLSVPCGFSPDGIPISIQFIGKPLAETTLCRAGYAYEQAHDHHMQHPAL